MTKTPMTIKVPGKLMVAGEFAVLEPYQKLAVMAVDRFVYATIEQSTSNSLSLETFHLTSLNWHFQESILTIDTEDKRTRFVKEAMKNTLIYLQEYQIEVPPFSLTINSELDDVSGKKYGLGSSAAVVTSVVAAILTKFLPVLPSKTLIFKLAAISHVQIQGNGSGADIAASTYGGLLEYTSFQAEWLLHEIEATRHLTELVKKKWTYYTIQPLRVPEKLEIYIGWTGQPASTSQLVSKVYQLKGNKPADLKAFLSESQYAVEHFLEGIKTRNIDLLLQGIKQNRSALVEVGENAGVVLETPELAALCDLAEQFGGAGKLSGAGGGDCGLAFMPTKERIEPLFKAWEKAGIQPLDLTIYPDGATVMTQ